jgi:hypothetical protein
MFTGTYTLRVTKSKRGSICAAEKCYIVINHKSWRFIISRTSVMQYKGGLEAGWPEVTEPLAKAPQKLSVAVRFDLDNPWRLYDSLPTKKD